MKPNAILSCIAVTAGMCCLLGLATSCKREVPKGYSAAPVAPTNVTGGSNVFTSVPGPPPGTTLQQELDVLSQGLNAKLAAGTLTQSDVQHVIAQVERLRQNFKPATDEDRASLLMIKAMIYVRFLNDPAGATEALRQVQKEYPATQTAGSAQQAEQSLERDVAVQKIREQLRPGLPFPDFEGQDLEGNPLSIATFKGKVVLVDFWATWCPPCVAEMPNIQRVYQKHKARGFEVLGINLDEDRKALDTFLRRNEIPWPQHWDGKRWESPVAQKYAINALPTSFLLDRNGRILALNLHGPILESAVEMALAATERSNPTENVPVETRDPIP
ncbi:MAG TPA: TlpA disulfide reductase family protein [Verrucomicrobiae bacterium]|nr:TlpA disulfide reductase family protein [Verrucomicrobiae bacterium]